jgi:hypothetical protein
VRVLERLPLERLLDASGDEVLQVSKLSVVVVRGMLSALAIAGASCRVYDSELLEQLDTGSRSNSINASGALWDAAAAQDSDDAGDGPVIVPACGNAHLDARERCDIAIPRGEQGACPDGCNAQDGCFAQELLGQRCGARCEPVEITESVPGDGCCPKGATPASDSDCSGTCGNGVIEASETCDPPGSCARPETCVPSKVCMAAQLTGAAETCSARCQEQPITSCVSGDGCCPRGCDAREDGDLDCPIVTETTPTVPTTGEAGSSAPTGPATVCMNGQQCTEEQLANECSMVHTGGRCHSCDCTYCAAEVASCESITADTRGCSRLVECALQNHCQGFGCLCGDSLSTCQSRPAGPCLREIRELAGTREFYGILLNVNTPGTPLALAMGMLQCRADHCAETCGL